MHRRAVMGDVTQALPAGVSLAITTLITYWSYPWNCTASRTTPYSQPLKQSTHHLYAKRSQIQTNRKMKGKKVKDKRKTNLYFIDYSSIVIFLLIIIIICEARCIVSWIIVAINLQTLVCIVLSLRYFPDYTVHLVATPWYILLSTFVFSPLCKYFFPVRVGENKNLRHQPSWRTWLEALTLVTRICMHATQDETSSKSLWTYLHNTTSSKVWPPTPTTTTKKKKEFCLRV